MGNGESDRLSLGRDPSSNRVRFLRLFFAKAGVSKIAQKADRTSQRGINTKFFDCHFSVDPGFTSALQVTITASGRLSTASVRNAFQPQTIRTRMTTCMSSTEVLDHAARFQPGWRIFVDPGSQKSGSYDKLEAEYPGN